MVPPGNPSSNRNPSPPPPSIIGCFSEKLYEIPGEPNPKYHAVQPSGDTTAATPPPRVLMNSPIQHFQVKAREFLKNSRLLEMKLDTTPIYARQPEVPHENEAAIVHSTYSYVTGPMNQLFHVAFPERYKMKVEHNTPVDQDIDENGESVLRCDICYTQPDGEENKVAVLELKRPVALRHSDYTRAIVADGDNATRDKKIEELNAIGQDTFLKVNGKSYAKQVKAYAIRCKCPHVALFNWEHFIIFNFGPVELGKHGIKVADTPKVSWVQEDGSGPWFAHEAIIREVMLGWVVQAFEDAGIRP